MGRKAETYQFVHEQMDTAEDGTRTWTYGFKVNKPGDDVLSFVHGDVAKIDDAIKEYEKSSDHMLDVTDMDAVEYVQVKLTTKA